MNKFDCPCCGTKLAIIDDEVYQATTTKPYTEIKPPFGTGASGLETKRGKRGKQGKHSFHPLKNLDTEWFVDNVRVKLGIKDNDSDKMLKDTAYCLRYGVPFIEKAYVESEGLVMAKRKVAQMSKAAISLGFYRQKRKNKAVN